MNADEYTNLERVERDHWYYSGKRELVTRWLDRVGALGRERLLLDCGAGTGAFAASLKGLCRVRVLDDHAESLALLRGRFDAAEIIEGTITRIPLGPETCDVVTALDVLEHVPDDRGAVRELYRVLKPGGVALVTVPALRSLWSEWDVVLHHQRRYHAAELRSLFGQGWQVLHWNYTNVAALPAVWLVRRWQTLRGARGGVAGRMEDKVPPAPINALLRRLFVGMGLFRRPRFPGGVSLLLLAQKEPIPPIAQK